MNYRNERMARGFRSLDALLEGFDASKLPALSDGGDGARQIRRAAWGMAARSVIAPYRERCVAEARMRIAEAGLARLLPVLDQVVLNGKNRRESICRLSKIWHVKLAVARRKYYRGSKTLLTFFSANKIKGEMHIEMPE